MNPRTKIRTLQGWVASAGAEEGGPLLTFAAPSGLFGSQPLPLSSELIAVISASTKASPAPGSRDTMALEVPSGSQYISRDGVSTEPETPPQRDPREQPPHDHDCIQQPGSLETV